jgi:hypothetical protein
MTHSLIVNFFTRLQEYRYVVNRDGEVRKWTYDIPKSELRPEQITPETIEQFSPLPKPPLSQERVAQVLIGMQNHAIQKSFRSILPKGAFHDTVIDSRTGQELEVPGLHSLPIFSFSLSEGSPIHALYLPFPSKLNAVIRLQPLFLVLFTDFVIGTKTLILNSLPHKQNKHN